MSAESSAEQTVEPVQGADESTQDRLLKSALNLFAQKGYDAASIREIIQDAGVTRPVLYYYFKNKEDLFCRLVEVHFDRAYAEIDEILAKVKECRPRLKALIRNAFERVEESPESVQFLLRFIFSPPDQPMRVDAALLAQGRLMRVAQIMQDALDEQEIFGGDATSLALAFCGFMDMHVMAKAHRPERKLTPELGESLVDLFLDGAGSAARMGEPLKFNYEIPK